MIVAVGVDEVLEVLRLTFNDIDRDRLEHNIAEAHEAARSYLDRTDGDLPTVQLSADPEQPEEVPASVREAILSMAVDLYKREDYLKTLAELHARILPQKQGWGVG